MQTMDSEIKDDVFVDEYTGGLVGPSLGFAATIKDGGHIRCVVPPGCWGPMITPEFRGGHEVTRPVAVEGARVGDALAITIESMRVLSLATSSGTMVTNKAAFGDDPFVDKKCPGCRKPGFDCEPSAIDSGWQAGNNRLSRWALMHGGRR